MPSTLITIGECAFRWCGRLTSITIPSSVTGIGGWAFQYCYALAEVYNYSSSITVSSDTSNGWVGYYAKAIYNASDLETEKPASKIQVIDNVQYYTDLESGDFIALAPSVARDFLTTLILDSRTTEINQHAFSSCSNLTNITIPEGVTSIGNYAFNGCSGLTNITIPEGVTSIGSGTFQDCNSLTSITISEGVTSISDYAFYGCTNLATIYIDSSTIANGITSPWSYIYLMANATTLYIKDTITVTTAPNGWIVDSEGSGQVDGYVKYIKA